MQIRYEIDSKKFSNIPGSPIAYWCSEAMINVFENGVKLGLFAPTKKGLDTGDNDKYLRFWHEVGFNKIGINYKDSIHFSIDHMKWAPHDKGGDYRRWYGNKDWVINWENDGFDLHHSKANLRNEKYYFKKAITWSSLSSGKISFRISNYGAISNTAGSSIYFENDASYLIGFLNSKIAQEILDIISPTLNYSAGPISEVPIILKPDQLVEQLSTECCSLSKIDWDSFETSWDFKKHPLI